MNVKAIETRRDAHDAIPWWLKWAVGWLLNWDLVFTLDYDNTVRLRRVYRERHSGKRIVRRLGMVGWAWLRDDGRVTHLDGSPVYIREWRTQV